MELMEAIIKRRSVRKYSDQPIPQEWIDEILWAGMNAPSAGNEQPWHFILLDDRTILEEIPNFHPHAQMLLSAPLAILVCGDRSLERLAGRMPLDCAAATQNMLLAATARGVGSCWVGLYPEELRIFGMRDLLELPEHVLPFALVALGMPAEEPALVDRFDTARVHHNGW